MSLSFTGRIARIFDAESFTSRDGRPFTLRRFILETVEQYPQRMIITVSNDLASNFTKSVGEVVTAYLSFDIHPNQNGSSFFNDIRAWRID